MLPRLQLAVKQRAFRHSPFSVLRLFVGALLGCADDKPLLASLLWLRPQTTLESIPLQDVTSMAAKSSRTLYPGMTSYQCEFCNE